LESTPLYAEVLAQAGAFESEADRADAADEDEAAGPDGRPLRDLLDSVRGGGRS
jgi:hypothetical protein